MAVDYRYREGGRVPVERTGISLWQYYRESIQRESVGASVPLRDMLLVRGIK